uniref:Venom peptide HtUy1 n=1 Tax=Hadogenes troglodytes TaxID=1577150 RepID=A0A1B3IJ53_9SCOR|nr:venom peptide HtUy1 [Hadogenes troglodytes]
MKAAVVAVLVIFVCCSDYPSDAHHCDYCPKQEEECNRICIQDHQAKCGYCTGKGNSSCLCPENDSDCNGRV